MPLSLLSLFVLVPAFALPFPVPLTPERAVSAGATTPYVPARQDVEIASSAHGYAIVWHEEATDYSSRAFVRRFSAAGAPLDDQPIPVVTILATPYTSAWAAVTIAATRSTYILGWQGQTGFVIRRMDAETGAWLDEQPIPVGRLRSVHLASNGADALAVGIDGCGFSECLAARAINLAGTPLVSPPVTLRIPDDHTINEVILGSNGTDYLTAWVENPTCHSTDLCGGPIPAQVYALRLRADAMPIDDAPLALDISNRPAFGLAIASSSGRYLLAWGTSGAIVGTRITDDGAVLDLDPHAAGGAVVLVERPAGVAWTDATVAGLNDRFVLVTRHYIEDLLAHIDQTYAEGVSFGANADLAGVRMLPRTPIFAVEDNLGRSLFATTSGSALALAYNRGATAHPGVTTVFLRLFSEAPAPSRRHAAR